VIFPEGGRSPDGWGQEFKGGAAYLSNRTGAPVVPVFIDGTGSDLRQGHEATQARQDARSCSVPR
jgi:1-acyl-sn-glycerol-3-phosphate acyltransferase